MKFAPNWKTILLRSLSVKAMALSAILGGFQASLTMLAPQTTTLEPAFGLPPGSIGATAAVVAALGILLRTVAQPGITDGQQ